MYIENKLRLPSFFIPALKHLRSLQYLHWFLLSLSTMQFLLNLKFNYPSEIVHRIKNRLKIYMMNRISIHRMNIFANYLKQIGIQNWENTYTTTV